MKAASEPSHREISEDAPQKASEERAAQVVQDHPLPGVMDFIGAHVDGELAEERWR